MIQSQWTRTSTLTARSKWKLVFFLIVEDNPHESSDKSHLDPLASINIYTASSSNGDFTWVFPLFPRASVAMPLKSQFNWKFHSCIVLFRGNNMWCRKNMRTISIAIWIQLIYSGGFNYVCPPLFALVSCQTCSTGKINCGRVPEWRRNWPSSLAAATSTALGRLIIQIIVSRRRSSFVRFSRDTTRPLFSVFCRPPIDIMQS